MGLRIVTGSRRLGGFIRDGAAEKSWLSGKFEVWAESVGTLAGVSRKHLQSAYAGLQKSFQQEWAFVQLVTPGIGDASGLVEQALQETFILDIFYGLGEVTPGRGVTCLIVKQAGLALPDSTKTATEN